MVARLVLDDGNLEAGEHEAGVHLPARHNGVVRSRARTIELEHFAEQLLQVCLTEARAQEQERPMTEYLCESAPEVRLAMSDAPIFVVVDHELTGQTSVFVAIFYRALGL